MRKVLVLLLAILYNISCIGATIYAHKCGTKITNPSLKKSETVKCGICKVKKTKKLNCCKDYKKLVKVDKPHHSVKKVSVSKSIEASSYLPSIFRKLFLINNDLFRNIFFFNDPPKKKSRKINILNCIYRN